MKVIKSLTFALVLAMTLISCRKEKSQNTNQQVNLKATQDTVQETTVESQIITETEELTPKEILAKAIEKCKAISSIEYTIDQKGAPGKFGY